MGQEINLLRSLPRTKRDVSARASEKSEDVVRVARCYGREYFDGDRRYGYGGYVYDGRWAPVARDIYQHYGLAPGQRVLDVGCAKGFLVVDLMDVRGLEAFGLDISRYAVVEVCHPAAVGRLHLGSADDLPFPDSSFDLVLSLDTIHNLSRERCKTALQEIARVSRGPAFVRVDAYRTEEERRRLEAWILTAKFWGSVEEWLELFDEAGYDGDYYWTTLDK